jgi:hypothetical protein
MTTKTLSVAAARAVARFAASPSRAAVVFWSGTPGL